MSEFIGKYENLRKESVEYITNFLKNNGGSFEFISQEEVESEEFYEIAYELPQATYVGKMEYTDYYAITSIRFEKDNIWLNGVNLGNDNDDYTFGVYEVNVACLCDCADLLIIKEK
jgi:hypothetical protein